MELFTLAFWLVASHFVADFQLQSDFVARNKTPGAAIFWPWVMTAHAALHGALVALVLNPLFGLAEFLSHWAIDYGKARGWFGAGAISFNVDQALHLVLKGVWLALYVALDQAVG
ncbi:MAG: DUF3307 domain-containing protein [Pseudomonadota bacterium]